MWRFYIFLVFAVVPQGWTTAEEVTHNLPDNLEIIDPKSLGLSDSDVEKFLGNVKLLPIGGDMGNNIKTQILTVGFEGDEKLDLADFEGLKTDGLPDKDKEVAQAAFSRFQEFFRNPGGSHDFDKVVADAEHNQHQATTTAKVVPQSIDPSTPDTTEPVSSYDYHDLDDQKTTTTIEPPPSTEASEEPESQTPKYSMSAEEVISLLKLNANSIQGSQNDIQKFGGFINSESFPGQNFARANAAPTPTASSNQQVQIQPQPQQSIQKQQVYIQQNEIQPQPTVVPSFIPFPASPSAASPTQQSYQQVDLAKPQQGFVPPHQDFSRQNINSYIIQQPSPSQAAPVGAPQPAPQIYHTHQVYTVPVQPLQQPQRAVVPLAHLPAQQPQQTHNFAQGVPLAFSQQPIHQSPAPQVQYVQSHNPQQQQAVSFPQPQPIHTNTFQPPQKFTQIYTPSRGPPHDTATATPRPGFQVTPSSPMIPISTAENAIHHAPVVRGHLHHPATSNENTHTEHLDIVAQIARQQHLRISQQPATLPSHPPQAQAQLFGKQQGREISQEPLKLQQNQQQPSAPLQPHQQNPSTPVIQQQQHYQFQQNPVTSHNQQHQPQLLQSVPQQHVQQQHQHQQIQQQAQQIQHQQQAQQIQHQQQQQIQHQQQAQQIQHQQQQQIQQQHAQQVQHQQNQQQAQHQQHQQQAQQVQHQQQTQQVQHQQQTQQVQHQQYHQQPVQHQQFLQQAHHQQQGPPQQQQHIHQQSQQHQPQIQHHQSQRPILSQSLSLPVNHPQHQRPLHHVQQGPQQPLISSQPHAPQHHIAHAKPIHTSPQANLQTSQSQSLPVKNANNHLPSSAVQQQAVKVISSPQQPPKQPQQSQYQPNPPQIFKQFTPIQKPQQPFQRPVNSHFPPSPPARPAPPPTRVFFPPPKNNVFFKDPRYNNNFNSNSPVVNRPPPQNYYFQNTNYRPNSIDASFGKSRFPTVRPDPQTFRPAFPPHRFSVNNNGNSHNIQGSFGSGEARPIGDSTREVRHYNFGNSRHFHQTNIGNSQGSNDGFVNYNNNDDLLAGGSEQSLSITKDLFKPDIIESIQPSRMVAYRYLTSSEN